MAAYREAAGRQNLTIAAERQASERVLEWLVR
jgi:hypothetical protein